MRKSTLMKVLSLVLCAMMALSLFACTENVVEDPTETKAPTTDGTETEAAKPTETDPATNPTETDPTEGSSDETSESTSETASETASETTPKPECGGVHDWETKAEGHYKEACEYCGEKAVDLTPHTFETDKDGKYCCTVC